MSGFSRLLLAVSCLPVALTLTLVTACAGPVGPAAPVSSGSSAGAAAPGYPVSVQNCGRTLTLKAAPTRVVSLWQAPAKMMLALGLRDRIAAMAGNYADFPANVAAEAKGIETIGTSMTWPSKEVLLTRDPDLAIGQSLEGYAFDTSHGYASVQQIDAAGAQMFGANMCGAKDNLKMTLDTPETALRGLGKISNASPRAEQIASALKAQKQKVADAAKDLPQQRVAFYNGGQGPMIVLAGGIYDDAMTTAGGKDVFPAESVYVSKESFAASNADVILVGTHQGQNFATLRDYLQKTFPDLPAVKAGRIVGIPVDDTDASISVMRGLTEIANAMHPQLKLAVPAS